MAFDRTKLNHIAGGLSPLPQTWEYSTSEEITSAGYFPKDIGILPGDKITKVNITKNVGTGVVESRVDTPYYVVADEEGVLTATAF